MHIFDIIDISFSENTKSWCFTPFLINIQNLYLSRHVKPSITFCIEKVQYIKVYGVYELSMLVLYLTACVAFYYSYPPPSFTDIKTHKIPSNTFKAIEFISLCTKVVSVCCAYAIFLSLYLRIPSQPMCFINVMFFENT